MCVCVCVCVSAKTLFNFRIVSLALCCLMSRDDRYEKNWKGKKMTIEQTECNNEIVALTAMKHIQSKMKHVERSS